MLPRMPVSATRPSEFLPFFLQNAFAASSVAASQRITSHLTSRPAVTLAFPNCPRVSDSDEFFCDQLSESLFGDVLEITVDFDTVDLSHDLSRIEVFG